MCSFVALLLQWFKGGITNICYNCLDRNVEAGLGDKVAFYWEGNELGVDATLTYTQLLHQVCQVSIFFYRQILACSC
jgi:acetyl-CoA synthetase